MKLSSLLVIVCLTLVAPFGAYAKKKGKGGGEPPAATPIPLPSAANPAEALSPYIVNLDQLLSFERANSTATQPLFTQTSGLLLTLRQQFSVELTKAPAEQKNMYTAAINTADLINAALEDRNKALNDLHTSQVVRGSGKLEEKSRKDNIAQGIHGDGLGKAVAVIEERDREKAAAKQAAARSGADQNALGAMAANQWNQRATLWHQKIAGAYSQIK
ncbi:MAG: hypothetical protein ABJF10_23050 [Chthoniobacter sp.]|uniref:hypothetical protein n=1 Tax=Chthoniobacter sp. TaxID=2510640 RepID=UPI0032A80688